jgi:PAS domain S-box-containing protein
LDRELSRQFGVAVYYDRPISLVMDRSPLMVEQDAPLEEVAKQAMARGKRKLYDHIVVTGSGKLEGVVTVKRMLDCLVQLQEGRASQLSRINRKLQAEIEERKRALLELEASREKYRDLFENVSDFLFVHDLDGNFLETNLPFKQEYGYTSSDFRIANARDLLPEEDLEAFEAYLERIQQTGGDEGYFRFIAADGRIAVIEYKNTLIRGADGEPVGVRGSGRDVTTRLRAEKEREALVVQLQRAQKMEAIGMLAGGVAHDLNNVLSGIVSYPDLLLLQIPPESPLRRPIETIRQSGQKAAAIVQDLLSMARRGVTTKEAVNLNDIVDEYLVSPEHEKLLAAHAKIRIEKDLDEDLLNMMGSPVHLSKTLMNLVTNAAEAMSEGGRIRIRTENVYIDRSSKAYDDVSEGEYVALAVSDSGIGISEEDRDRIFEPFYTKKKMGSSGTGLGMAVVWGTVKDHGGYVDLKSREGEGTTFTLYFPIARTRAQKRRRDQSVQAYRGIGESILVVDDVQEQREIAATLLSELGYSVTSVPCGEDAVRYLNHHVVDLLVLDMIMEPGIDGLETYRRILKAHPGQRAIITSGFSETERIREAQRLGAGRYVRKPYTLEAIGAAVRAELDKDPGRDTARTVRQGPLLLGGA